MHTLRDKNCLLFWLRNSDKKELHSLMTSRIHQMINDGGLKEILSVLKYAQIHGFIEGLKSGALQSIGYKEFIDVYNETKDLLSDE